MGNSIYRFLCGLCAQASSEHGLHGAHPAVAALGRDILSFGANSQVTIFPAPARGIPITRSPCSVASWPCCCASAVT
jgi:hypothetical protein